MKTIVCEEPNRFEKREVAMPEPKDGEVLLKMQRIGICGTDLHAYHGDQPYFTYPRRLGHEVSGEIVEIGSNDAGLRSGESVVIMPYLACGKCIACRKGLTNACMSLSIIGVHQDGGMAEYITMPESHLIKAEGLKAEQMAIVECLSIGAHATRRANVQPGQKVLVIGAGPIGIGAMQFVRNAGAEVIAMDINAGRLAYCRDVIGVKHLVNAGDNPKEQLEEITGGEYPDVVMEATGNPKSMETAFQYVSHGGTYVLISLVKADIAFSDPEFHKREMNLLSSRNATKQDMENVVKAMQAGEVETERFITHRASFDTMIDTFESWLDPANGVIKAVVEF
jgi:2-desacetyl-2-hydroxyethyl bacteriochlorophyllide A dehydrogenase